MPVTTSPAVNRNNHLLLLMGSISMDNRKPSFLKALLEDFDSKLEMPKACTEMLESVPSEVTIRTQNGSWAVKLEKKLNESGDAFPFYLRGHEWVDLVKHNEFEKGDILVFSLLDRSQFHLFMFGKTSCLKKVRKPEKTSKKALRPFARFEVKFKKFNLFGLSLPEEFVGQTGMQRMKKVMVKDCEGREFSVKVNPGSHEGLMLADGWGKFVTQNGLEVGMTCLIQCAIQDADDPVLIVSTVETI